MVVSDIQCFSQVQYTGPLSTMTDISGAVVTSSVHTGNVVATGNIQTTKNLYVGNIVFNSVLVSTADDATASSAGVPVGGIYANVGMLQIRLA